MRLRLVHTLSLLLLSAVLLSVLAMGGVMAWNLKNGFADYLAARDLERLTQFAAVVETAAEEAGGIEALTQKRLDMRELLERFALDQGILEQTRRSPPRRAEGPGRPERNGERPPRGPPPIRHDGFGPRVAVVGLDGEPLIGRPLPPDAKDFVDQPVRVDGEVVAFVRLRSGDAVPSAVEARFLQSQYVGIVVVSAILMLLAISSAWWLARRWVRPLLAVQSATTRIARGEFDVRLGDGADGQARQDEIGDLVRNINQMAEGLQRLESARRRWVADISHELRTPLAVLRGEIEALVDGVRPLRIEAMHSLKEEVLKLGALVDDLHLLAMADLQALPCQFDDEDAVQIVKSAVSRFAARADKARLSLSVEVPVPDVIPVFWDCTRIEQLLVNLLENSLRYTDAPGHIVLTLKQQGDRVIIVISDSAPGVAQSDLSRLFEPLYRADSARSSHRGGSGLGLAICDAIVRSHGGRIHAAQSALGGVAVHIDFPATGSSN